MCADFGGKRIPLLFTCIFSCSNHLFQHTQAERAFFVFGWWYTHTDLSAKRPLFKKKNLAHECI